LKHESLNAQYVRRMPKLKGRDDHILMGYANQTRRIMVTTESGINERTFRICTHPGTIILPAGLAIGT
jgi:predicted nuclease of predicted toxin-antitoxin system